MKYILPLLYSNRQKDERDQTHVIFYKLYYIQSYSHRYKFIKFIKLILQMKFGFYLFLAEIGFNLSCCFADIHGIMLKSKELTDNDGFTAMDNYQAAHHLTIVKVLKRLLIIATPPLITKVRVSNVSDSERCWLLQSSHGS